MLIFLDLDGTVIGSNGVSPAVSAAIDAARDAGLRLVVCTGRPRAGIALEVAHRFGAGPHIFESGALIAPASGRPLHVDRLPSAALKSLAAHTAHTRAVLEFYTPEGIFVSQLNADCEEHARVIGVEAHQADLATIADTVPVMRAHWIMRPDSRDEALSLVHADVEVGEASSPVLPGFLFASITKKGVSKGTAAARVAAIAGFTLDDCWAVGDAEGDRPVLEVVGHPRVMANAPAALKNDFPTIESVEHDGVAHLLHALLKQVQT